MIATCKTQGCPQYGAPVDEHGSHAIGPDHESARGEGNMSTYVIFGINPPKRCQILGNDRSCPTPKRMRQWLDLYTFVIRLDLQTLKTERLYDETPPVKTELVWR